MYKIIKVNKNESKLWIKNLNLKICLSFVISSQGQSKYINSLSVYVEALLQF